MYSYSWASKWVLGSFCILFSYLPFQTEAQMFGNTLSMAEFGAIPNTIITFQPSSTYGIDPLDLRTNDYQNLQIKYGSYAFNRAMTRMGALQNSQCPIYNTVASPGTPINLIGPGITFPDHVAISDPGPPPPNPARNITIDTNRNRLIFSATESQVDSPQTIDIVADPTISGTGQALTLEYQVGPGQSITDYNVVGNAFHDMLYQSLTPSISCPLADYQLTEVTVFGPLVPGGEQTFTTPGTPPLDVTLPAGNKLRIKIFNTTAAVTQTWVLYLQESDGSNHTTPPAFKAYFGGSGISIPFGGANTILEAQGTFSGFIRVGIVQTDPVPFFPVPNTVPTEVDIWSTGIGIQTFAPSPAAIFMLWPVDFVAKATKKIENNFQTMTYLPDCIWLSTFLPVLARLDIYTANLYFSQLLAKPASLPPFDPGTNPFLTYLYMNLAHNYSNDVSCYQANERPFPNYGITATPASAENVYDAYRDIIPTNAELGVALESYAWTYTTIGAASKNPLIIFPRYKTLNSTQNPAIPGFLINDPLKGILYGTEAINKQATFREAPLPSFLTTQFFPDDFWKRLSTLDVILAKSYLDLYFDDPANLTEIVNITSIPGITPNVYNNGKLLYKAASSVRYATALMKYLKISDAAIIAKTQPFVDAIKQALESWLFTLQTSARTGVFPDPTKYFFIGDSTVGGICATINGMLAGSNAAQASDIFGNAEYNDHHFQYGYWLGAAAAVIDWDNQYGTSPPWIAQTHLSGSGAGPFKMKSFVDVLWRDTVNPDPQDPDFPYHRHGNPWEGHSTANGLILPDPFAAGRNQESLAEDFNCWLGALFYAKAVLGTNAAFPGALNATDLQGFPFLVDFCSTFLSMTATSGNLYYNTPNWPYANIGFNFNATVGNQFDGLVDSATFFGRGDDPCSVCN